MGHRRRRPAWDARNALVLVALSLVAGCTIRARPEPSPSSGRAPAATATTVAATTRGTTTAVRAFVLERDWGGGPVRPAPAGPLPVALRRRSDGDDQATNLLLVFPLLRSPPRCVREVVLWLRVLSLDYEAAAIAAYPSLLVSLATARPVGRAGWATLIDNRPRGTGTLTADQAWMHFDITGLYRTWAEGGPFPSQLRTVDPGTPLVVDVRPEAFAEPYFQARFAPLDEGGDSAPHLRWRVTRGCRTG